MVTVWQELRIPPRYWSPRRQTGLSSSRRLCSVSARPRSPAPKAGTVSVKLAVTSATSNLKSHLKSERENIRGGNQNIFSPFSPKSVNKVFAQYIFHFSSTLTLKRKISCTSYSLYLHPINIIIETKRQHIEPTAHLHARHTGIYFY